MNIQYTKKMTLLLAGMLVGVMPLLFLMQTGAAGAGLSAGFVYPLEHIGHLLLFALIGVLAVSLSGEGMLMLPVSFVLMLVVGACSELTLRDFPAVKLVLFCAVMLYALSIGAAFGKRFLLVAIPASALAYPLGAHYVGAVPDIGSVSYFLLGAISSVALSLLLGVSVVFAGLGYWQKMNDSLKKMPAFAGFFALF